MAGLVLASSTAVEAQTGTPPPAPQPPAASTPAAQPGTPPAVPAAVLPLEPAAKPLPERLDADQLANIEEELEDLLADNAGVSHALLRSRLTARAETLAAETLGISTKQLAQCAGIRRQLRTIIRPLIDKIPRATDEKKPSTATPDDDHSHRRCECIYCHSLHTAGTCPLPCLPVSLPTLPTVGSYAAAPYYVIPYVPRQHVLHGLLCPCAWCRGRW
jgi:hypothetical protein